MNHEVNRSTARNRWRVLCQAGFVVNNHGEGEATFELIMRAPQIEHVLVRCQALDKDRLRIGDDDPVPPVILRLNTQLPTQRSFELERIIVGLGRKDLSYGHCQWDVAEFPTDMSYCGVTVLPLLQQGVHDAVFYRPLITERLYVERKKSELSMSRNDLKRNENRNYGFLCTKKEVDSRVNELIQRGRQLNRFRRFHSETETNALNNLFFQLLSGVDSPLLKERI